MSYVDGFVVPVPEGNKEAYLEVARKMRALFKQYGATRIVECWGNDVPDGKVTDFKKAVDLQNGEAVVFSWVEWPSKAVRDTGSKALMEDPLMQSIGMPFDGKRMIFGGFEVMLDSAAEG